MTKSQRASETQSVRNLKQSITNIRKEISPVPTVSSIGSNPRAMPLSKSRWIRRPVRVSVQTTSGSVVVKYVDVALAIGAAGVESYTVKVLGIKAWNVTGLATTSNSIQVQLGTQAITALLSGIQGEDFGSGQSLPGVKINIPDLLAAARSTTEDVGFCTITTPNSGANVQTICVDLDIMYQM